MSGKKQSRANPSLEAFRGGCALVAQHPVLGPLMREASALFDDSYPLSRSVWASVSGAAAVVSLPVSGFTSIT